MTSTSTLVKDFLTTKEVGYTFTSAIISKELGLGQGAVAGMITRLARIQAITLVSTKDRFYEYVLSDLDLLKSVQTKDQKALGGQPGRHILNRRTQKVISPQTITDQLLDIAAQLEHLTPDLSLVSTEALLAEIKKRTKT